MQYINWYLSGWVGGLLMRQGYYSAAPETSKQYMSADEWGFWFEGKAAESDIIDPFGNQLEKPVRPVTVDRSMTAWAESNAGIP